METRRAGRFSELSSEFVARRLCELMSNLAELSNQAWNVRTDFTESSQINYWSGGVVCWQVAHAVTEGARKGKDPMARNQRVEFSKAAQHGKESPEWSLICENSNAVEKRPWMLHPSSSADRRVHVEHITPPVAELIQRFPSRYKTFGGYECSRQIIWNLSIR